MTAIEPVTAGTSLLDFTTQMRTAIDNFEKYWFRQNRINPEAFPLNFDKDNAGAWMEQFIAFGDIKDPDVIELSSISDNPVRANWIKSILDVHEYDELIKHDKENTGFFIKWTSNLDPEGSYIIIPVADEEIWMASFDSEIEALEFCVAMGWKLC